MKEKSSLTLPGWLALILAFAALGGAIHQGIAASGLQPSDAIKQLGTAGGLVILFFFLLSGMFTMEPNEARVLQLFGRYVGTTRAAGWQFVNPFYSKRRVSLRMQTFETAKIKVNDLDGSPIEIAAIVVWRIVDTAQACFAVENAAAYVHIQAEAAVRNLATHHPYDAHDESTISLRGHIDVVAEQLKREVQAKCKPAGVEVVEARIGHLAYAQEIAQAMLQRQQAGAIIAARQRIVEGAVGMVQMALEQLSIKGVVDLDNDRKAMMVANLLVVLCGERATQPIVNAGST